MTTSPEPASDAETTPERIGDISETVQDFASEQTGYRKQLTARQINMIAIGGAIGTGLFLGAGGRLHQAGPLLVVVYAVCGFFAFLVLRALGELVSHRASSGSFVSYAREFFGEKAAYAAGWLYFLNWAMTAIVDVTAAAIYVKYWSLFSAVPQWMLALIALALVVTLNLISVRVFGEMEFWFAIVKVGALVIFLIIGIVVLAAGWPTAKGATGLAMLSQHGGLLPHGVETIALAVVLVQGVVFAYAGVELVGVAAGETKDPASVMPRAINSVVFRIAVFYCGSVLLLALLLPSSAYSSSESPFVTFFASVGGTHVGSIAGSIMNAVVLTAALSSLNAGLYSTGRILRSLAHTGAAPRFTGRMSRRGVPYGGIVLTAGIGTIGVFLNLVVPADAFNIVLNVACLGIISSWAMIVLCQMRLRRWALDGKIVRPRFRLFGAPWTSWLTLAFLATVLVLMAFDYPTGTYTIASLAILIPALVAGWFLQRDRINALARERDGFTGSFPAVSLPTRRRRAR